MNERDLFMAALQIDAPAGRAAYLERACGDDAALRQRVDALLEALTRAGSFLQAPAENPASTLDFPGERSVATGSATETPGTVIGSYKLLQQIGEGGMGVVWMAEQSQPVQRKVALKVIKAGMDSRQVIARFEAERQALAMMDHPNIAKVLDGGATAGGRPYFVMELVKGVPITRYCDEHHLTPRERLELFVPICHAVQHAHQKGIIHRDLKPSNVMVCLYDGRPVPKVIDFGVVKAAGPRLTEKTLFTEIGSVVGTLEYMSPEQAELNQLDVDTRSDIYSLGVLLYELLTGTTPLTTRRTKEAAFLEVLRLIREEEPPRPSTRLGDSGGALASISAQRQTEPAKLTKLIRGELDWIVMKALEKDRNRRYETANGFAQDIERYLNDEAVQACPQSAWYRVRKIVRRNKTALVMATLTSTALVLALVVLAISNARIGHEKDRKEEALRQAQASEQSATYQLGLTQQAEASSKLRLYRSLVEQARSGRLSRRVGQRLQSLEVLGMAQALNLPEEDKLELRNEVIACLAVADLRLVEEWPGWRSDDARLDFDSTLAQCACTNREGACSIRRRVDGKEIARLLGVDTPAAEGAKATPLFSRDGAYVAISYYPSCALRVWKLGGAEPELVVDESFGVTSLDFSPDSRLLSFGHVDGAIQVIELPSQRRLPSFKIGFLPQYQAFHPTRRQFAVASNQTKIQIYDVDSGKLLDEWVQPAGVLSVGLTGICWSPDGRLLAAVANHSIYVWDPATHKELAQLQGHQKEIEHVAFNHAGDVLASSSWDGTLRLWDPRTGEQLFQTQADVRALRFSPDDQQLAGSVRANKLQACQVAQPAYRTLIRDPALGRGDYHDCAICPKSDRLAVRMGDGVGLWDLRTCSPLTFLPMGSANAVLFEKSGALLTNGPIGLLRWPITEASHGAGTAEMGPPRKLPLPGCDDAIARSRDGRILASAQGWGALVWQVGSTAPPIRLKHKDARFVSVSPEGDWIATGSYFGTRVKIWEERTGKCVHELPVEGASMVLFSPDSHWLATTGGGCRLWGVPSWQEGPKVGHGGALGFSPDGHVLAVEDGHGVVRLVNPDTGREYARLEDPNQDRACSIAFVNDGSQLVATNEDHNSIHVWDLRSIRTRLTKLGLDWEQTAYPPPRAAERATPVSVHLNLGELGAAIEARGNYRRGLACVNAGQWAEAVEAYKKATELDPNNGWAHNGLAMVFATCPVAKFLDAKQAIEHAKKAVALAPLEGNFWNTLGIAHYYAGDWKAALDDLKKSMSLQKGGDANDWLFVAMAHWKLGDKELAAEWYSRAAAWMAKNASPYNAIDLARFRGEAAKLLEVKK